MIGFPTRTIVLVQLGQPSEIVKSLARSFACLSAATAQEPSQAGESTSAARQRAELPRPSGTAFARLGDSES
jgi:hypothetical protein